MTQQKLDKELIFYIEKNNLEKVKEFVTLGANVNIKCNIYGDTPIICAVLNQNFEMMKYLFSKGADPTIKNESNRNIFTHAKLAVKTFNVLIEQTKYSELINWIMDYSTQKELLTKYPHAIQELCKNKLLNDQIREDFKDLISGSELNLL
jgi:ankyrin repeat protein